MSRTYRRQKNDYDRESYVDLLFIVEENSYLYDKKYYIQKQNEKNNIITDGFKTYYIRNVNGKTYKEQFHKYYGDSLHNMSVPPKWYRVIQQQRNRSINKRVIQKIKMDIDNYDNSTFTIWRTEKNLWGWF